jgi:hypothetical protein
MPEHYEPPNALRFYDVASHREMLLDYDTGWLCYRHPDGQWVTLRKATPNDLARLSRAGAVHPGDVADRPARGPLGVDLVGGAGI